MSGKRYAEGQIVRILGETEGGRTVATTDREYAVSEGTIYRWRTKFGGMELSKVRRLKELEAENARLRRLLAGPAMDSDARKAGEDLGWRVEHLAEIIDTAFAKHVDALVGNVCRILVA